MSQMPVLYRCEPLSASITREQCERNRTRGRKSKFGTDLVIFACERCGGLGLDEVKIDLEAEMAKKICDVKGCTKIVHAHGKCWRHEREILGIDPATGKKLVSDMEEQGGAVELSSAEAVQKVLDHVEKAAKVQVKETYSCPVCDGDLDFDQSILECCPLCGAGMMSVPQELKALSDEMAACLDSLGAVGVTAEFPKSHLVEEQQADPAWSVSAYVTLGMEIGALVERKQAAYGDSYGKSGDIMRILYPDGIRPEQYDDALGVVRTVDKLFRVATDRDALGESPWGDIAGYGLLGAARAKGLVAAGADA